MIVLLEVTIKQQQQSSGTQTDTGSIRGRQVVRLRFSARHARVPCIDLFERHPPTLDGVTYILHPTRITVDGLLSFLVLLSTVVILCRCRSSQRLSAAAVSEEIKCLHRRHEQYFTSRSRLGRHVLRDACKAALFSHGDLEGSNPVSAVDFEITGEYVS